MTNYESVCKLQSSKKCIKIFKNPFAKVPKCKNDPIFKGFPKNYRDPRKIYNCLQRAEGQLCPTVMEEFTKRYFTRDAILETCKSKACTEGLAMSIPNS